MQEEYHGGQDRDVSIIFKDDFSVTTNFLGSSKKGLNYIKNNINNIKYYPPQNYEPYLQNFKRFINNNIYDNEYILLGNGASELIDLLIRSVKGKSWKPSKFDIQYLEYERCCHNNKKEKTNWDNYDSDLTCIINPNNPTGDYINKSELKKYIIRYCKPNSSVIIDESMQPWFGENWRTDSLISEHEWIRKLSETKSINIYIIHSWTKFFSCTGLRYGSLICPNKATYDNILINKIPWSVNILSLMYMDNCIKDDNYMKETWDKTKKLRKNQVSLIKKYFPDWKIYGEDFLSWIWIDTNNKNLAFFVYNLCKQNGTPIRYGKYGYDRDRFLRISVRNEESFNLLIENIRNLYFIRNNPIHITINNNIIEEFSWVEIDKIKCHEEFINERHENLLNYLKSIQENFNIPAIILCSKNFVIIDGHHRFSVLKKLNIKKIPSILINYFSDCIIVNDKNKQITKDMVIKAGLIKEYLPPKSTCHMIKDSFGNSYPIINISPMVNINI